MKISGEDLVRNVIICKSASNLIQGPWPLRLSLSLSLCDYCRCWRGNGERLLLFTAWRCHVGLETLSSSWPKRLFGSGPSGDRLRSPITRKSFILNDAFNPLKSQEKPIQPSLCLKAFSHLHKYHTRLLPLAQAISLSLVFLYRNKFVIKGKVVQTIMFSCDEACFA